MPQYRKTVTYELDVAIQRSFLRSKLDADPSVVRCGSYGLRRNAAHVWEITKAVPEALALSPAAVITPGEGLTGNETYGQVLVTYIAPASAAPATQLS